MTSFTRFHIPILTLLLLAATGWVNPVAAQPVTCTLSSTTVNYGIIDPFGVSDLVLGGTVTMNCNNGTGGSRSYDMCLDIGTGTGGLSGSSRALLGGTTRLPIQLRSPPAAASEAGDGTTWPRTGPIAITVPGGGSASVTFPIGVTLTAPGVVTPSPGTYTSVFTGTALRAYTASLTCVPTTGGGAISASGSLTVTAQVIASCTMSATSMNFGSASFLTTARNASATLTLRCNAAVPATISMDNGAGGGTGPTDRRMSSGVNRIRYGVYRDAAGTQPWGATAGSDTQPVTTVAGNITVPVYGVVPVQPAPTPGNYTDTIIVTVTY